MCGIAGFISVNPEPRHQAVLERMTAALHHRGPDDSGFYYDARAALGHRRLSIIDLAAGQQPMSNEDGSLLDRLQRRDLQPRRSAPRTRARRPPLQDALRHRNHPARLRTVRRRPASTASAACSPSPSGTRDARTLFCARDRLGIKPFYYYWDGRLFAFASEIKALLEHPAISHGFDEAPLPEYLAFGYLSGERTLFSRHPQADARPSRCTLDAGDGSASRCDIQRYWDVPAPAALNERTSAVLDRGMPRAPGRDRPHAADERRAARHVPERRRRFERHRRAHAAHGAPARSRPSRSATAEAAYSELAYARAGRRAPSVPSTTRWSSAWRISSTPCRA